MSKVEKSCQTCGKPFLADTREINRGNAKYCSLSCAAKAPKALKYKQIFKHCGKEFNSASSSAKYCSDSCKQKDYRDRQKDSSEEGVSIKSLYTLFKDIPCEICNWNKASRDLHHIKEVANRGITQIENIICVCPNCHRMIHSNLISEDNLMKIVNNRTISSSSIKEELDAKSGN